MNYPVWDVSFGSGLLIAIISVVHVFVSHFAVGGGLFLVLTERKAYKENNSQLVGWLKTHSKFFVLLTVVFGAITGVGIWFTIALVNPSATSALIHAFVWGWAIEWVFFFLEITAALLYLYGWKRLDKQTHIWIGWIYFLTAFLSMVVINGIITFMLTSGNWVESKNFWDGFFNPTYWPSLFIRFAFSLSLAGLYALITISRIKDSVFKSFVAKWSLKWVLPSFILLPIFAYWYVANIPVELFQSTNGLMATATQYATLISIFALITFLLALVYYFFTSKINLLFSLLILITAFVTMWSFEFIRESIRKPYVIANYMYGNSIYTESSDFDQGFSIEKINENGILNTAKWISIKKITKENSIQAGEEIFRVECLSCHTYDAYRGVRNRLIDRGWDKNITSQMISRIEHMQKGIMPPFAGFESERESLSDYLHNNISQSELSAFKSGKGLFDKYCQVCHQYSSDDPVFFVLTGADREEVEYYLTDLQGMNDLMPNLVPNSKEIEIMMDWFPKQFINQN